MKSQSKRRKKNERMIAQVKAVIGLHQNGSRAASVSADPAVKAVPLDRLHFRYQSQMGSPGYLHFSSANYNCRGVPTMHPSVSKIC